MAGKENQLKSAVESLEQASGLTLCLKILNPSSRGGSMLGQLPRAYQLHQTEFCRRVKQTRNSKCIECDLRRVPALCNQKQESFIHTCHAGASEVILPIFLHGRLAALGYLGQFRYMAKQPSELPVRTAEDRKKLLGLATMAAAYFSDRIRTPRYSRETSRGFRQEAIWKFLLENLNRDPGLPELAGHLGLSVTRTAHAVREVFGKSFVQVRDQIRLERACALLQETHYKIASVAEECGFASPQYFHRFFRRQTGVTPLAFRKKRRIEV